MLKNCYTCVHDRGEECAELADDDLFAAILAWLWRYREQADRTTGTPPKTADNCPGWGEQKDTEEEENAIDAAAEAGTLTPEGPAQ